MWRVTRPLSRHQLLVLLCLSMFVLRPSAAAYAGTTQAPAPATPPPSQTASGDQQQSGSTTAPAQQSASADQSSDDERITPPGEPEFRLINLATTLRLPKHKATFELTHRFDGNLREGSFA